MNPDNCRFWAPSTTWALDEAFCLGKGPAIFAAFPLRILGDARTRRLAGLAGVWTCAGGLPLVGVEAQTAPLTVSHLGT